MNSIEWITDAELKEANEKAMEIFDNFYSEEEESGGIGSLEEEIWTEIVVNNKYFDVNCWDEGIEDGYINREGAVHCILHRVVEDEAGVRSTDDDSYIRLFTCDRNLKEV